MPAMRSTHGLRRIGDFADEVGPELAHEPRPGGRVVAQRRDQVDAFLLAVGGDGAAAVRVDREGEVLGRVVVPVGAELVAVVVGAARAEPGQVPAGEHARRRLDVVLDDVGDAEREQLHDLARVVLLRARGDVVAAVQPHQDRRVLRDGDQQVAEVAEGVVAEQLELSLGAVAILGRLGGQHPRRLGAVVGAGDLRVGGGEVVVPEERHLLLEGALGVDHPEQPALAGVGDVEVRREGAAGGHADEAGLADLAVDVVRDLVEVHQQVDRAADPDFGIEIDLVRAAAEAGSPEEVLDLLFTSSHAKDLPDAAPPQ